MTNETRQETIDRLCSDYLDAKAYAEKHKDNADALKAQLLALEPDNSELRGLTITRPRTAFDAELAAKVLNAEQVEACSETKLSATKAKEVLPPAVYKMCTSASGGKSLRVAS